LLIVVLLMPFGGIFQQKIIIFTAHFKNTTHSIERLTKIPVL
jgi:hypothetical protein